MTDIKEAQGLEVSVYTDQHGTAIRADILRHTQIEADGLEPHCRLSDATAVIDQLRAENSRLRAHKNDYMDAAEGTRKALLERIAELEAQLVGYDKISRDANRYRWFRWNASESFYGNEVINLVNDPVSLDRAIDERLNRSKT